MTIHWKKLTLSAIVSLLFAVSCSSNPGWMPTPTASYGNPDAMNALATQAMETVTSPNYTTPTMRPTTPAQEAENYLDIMSCNPLASLRHMYGDDSITLSYDAIAYPGEGLAELDLSVHQNGRIYHATMTADLHVDKRQYLMSFSSGAPIDLRTSSPGPTGFAESCSVYYWPTAIPTDTVPSQ
jgi:hypothetical protein